MLLAVLQVAPSPPMAIIKVSLIASRSIVAVILHVWSIESFATVNTTTDHNYVIMLMYC